MKIIITYQEKLGNYNSAKIGSSGYYIITYQEKLGNYNVLLAVKVIRRL